MARRPCRNHSSEFNAKVALAAIRGDKTAAAPAQQFGVYINQITQWKSRLLGRAAEAFQGGGATEPTVDIKRMHVKIGEFTLENDFSYGSLCRRRDASRHAAPGRI